MTQLCLGFARLSSPQCKPLLKGTPSRQSARSPRDASLRVYKVFAAIIAAFALICQNAAAQTLLRDSEIEEWIRDYSFPIFRAAGLPAEGINLLLIGDNTPNAFAGGLNMGIHTGLITLADTPNQIEGVIAHETGHIKGADSARTAEAYASSGRPVYLALLLAAGAIAAGAPPEAGIGLLGLGQNIALANVLQYSQGQEAEADEAAVRYLNATGKSTAGLIEFFAKLRNPQIITAFRANPYRQTHPLANDRISALRAKAENSPYYDKKDAPEDIERLKLIQGKIKGFLWDFDDVLEEYKPDDRSDGALYARAAAYRNHDLNKSIAEIDALLTRYPNNPYFHELKGQILFENSKIEQSIPPFRTSVKHAPAEALLRINLGRALFATENEANYLEASKVLRTAVLIENDNAFGWFELSRVYGALGQRAQADLANAEYHYLTRRYGEAIRLATNASKKLPQGTPDWYRASDIIQDAKQKAKKAKR